jgi:hypothetical protein
LRREAAFGGGVDDEDHFAGVLREGIGRAFFCGGGGGGDVSVGEGGKEGAREENEGLLSLGVKSKNVVAEAMVRRCW